MLLPTFSDANRRPIESWEFRFKVGLLVLMTIVSILSTFVNLIKYIEDTDGYWWLALYSLLLLSVTALSTAFCATELT